MSWMTGSLPVSVGALIWLLHLFGSSRLVVTSWMLYGSHTELAYSTNCLTEAFYVVSFIFLLFILRFRRRNPSLTGLVYRVGDGGAPIVEGIGRVFGNLLSPSARGNQDKTLMWVGGLEPLCFPTGQSSNIFRHVFFIYLCLGCLNVIPSGRLSI